MSRDEVMGTSVEGGVTAWMKDTQINAGITRAKV